MDAENKEYFLIDYIKIVKENRKTILIITFSILVISSILFFLIIDPLFYSSGTIKGTSSSMNLSGLIGSAGLPDLGDLGEIAGTSSTAKELALYENILISRRCIVETIIKFDLMEENNYKYMQDAIKDFRENIMEIKKDKVAGTIEIGVFNKDPDKAKDISDFLISQLNKINIELNIQNAKDNRQFIEERYNLVKKDLKLVEDSLEYFQNRFGIAPDIQVQAALKTEIELEVEIKAEEVKLELMRKILSPDQSEIRELDDKISILKKQLEGIKKNSFEENKLNINGSPKIVMDYLRYKRDVEIQNKILLTLIPMLEKSKIDENRETPTIIILDSPAVPERKSKPKRLTNIALLTFLAFSFSSVFYILKGKWYRFFKKLQ